MTQPAPIKIGSYTYSETDIIGKGSFGKVYKGKSLLNGNVVAIKVIYVESNKQSMLIKMIKNEVEALRKAKNENIVQFLEFIVLNNNVYIVTEFCNQKDLRHYLSKYKILDEKKAVEFLKQIVNAFKELCRQQVFHRDLKPANILLHNGICKIADFGFAKTLDFSVTDYNTHMVSIVGTPLYMSPQLLDKQKYSTKSDIWSLGIIFYEMMFGKVPWVGKDPATYSKNIRSQPLVIDNSVNSISSEAEDFLRQCLKVEEEERIGWTELFSHPLINESTTSRSTKEIVKDGEFSEFLTPESRIKQYCKRPVNPSSLMKLNQDKTFLASNVNASGVNASQFELTRTTIDQKLKYISQFGLSQSIFGRVAATTTPHSKTFNMSINDDGKNGDILKSNQDQFRRLKSNGFLKDSRDLSPSPDGRGKSIVLKRYSDETLEEFKKIETPLLIMRNKLIVLSDLYNAVNSNEEFKEQPAIKFNTLITIAKLINVIFKNLSAQVLTKKVKTRSHLLADYLETDNFKRLVVFVETNKKGYEEMLKNCSRKLFELVLPSDKEKDEVLDYYQDVFNEVEEQGLLGKLVDVANQMLYQIRFSSQIYKRSVGANNQILESSNPNNISKEYFEGLLALFGDESILDTFKYDKIDDVLSKLEKLKEETRQRM